MTLQKLQGIEATAEVAAKLYTIKSKYYI